MCGKNGTHPTIYECDGNGSWPASYFLSCSSTLKCDAATGQCTALFNPRDRDFEVPRLIRKPADPPPPGLRTRHVLDMAVGIAFT
jgi:hypothetical protein